MRTAILHRGMGARRELTNPPDVEGFEARFLEVIVLLGGFAWDLAI